MCFGTERYTMQSIYPQQFTMVIVVMRHDYASHFKFLLIKILLQHRNSFIRNEKIMKKPLLFISWLKQFFCPQPLEPAFDLSSNNVYKVYVQYLHTFNICGFPISASSNDLIPVKWFTKVVTMRITTLKEQKIRHENFHGDKEAQKVGPSPLFLMITVFTIYMILYLLCHLLLDCDYFQHSCEHQNSYWFQNNSPYLFVQFFLASLCH